MYVIYRTWENAPYGKRVRRLPEPTVLEWVRAKWDEAHAQDGIEWLVGEIGFNVFGLDDLFQAPGRAPETMSELRTLMLTHTPDTIQCNVDEHSVRLLANGLWHDIAYYLVDDAAVASHPERWSFAVHDALLPDCGDEAPDGPPFVSPVSEVGLRPEQGAAGKTYALLFEPRARHDCLSWFTPFMMPGVRLSGLADALRQSEPEPDVWPHELQVLRALIAPEEDGIAPGLERCSRWPEFAYPSEDLLGHLRSHTDAVRLVDSLATEEDLHLIHVGRHVGQLSRRWGSTDYTQWIFFDDVWAAAYPDLAASLVYYAYHWDPMCSSHHLRELTPCNDNRILYLAIVGEAGQILVRPAEPDDDDRVLEFFDSWRKKRQQRPKEGEVVAHVDIAFHQPQDDEFAFGRSHARRIEGVTEALVHRIGGDLRRAGIRRARGWLPDQVRAFVRALGTIGADEDGQEVLTLS